MMTPQLQTQHADMTSPVLRLRCCCCGKLFQGRQFYNQDIGYGLGDCCVEHVTPRVEDVARTYGVSGVHYGIAAK